MIWFARVDDPSILVSRDVRRGRRIVTRAAAEGRHKLTGGVSRSGRGRGRRIDGLKNEKKSTFRTERHNETAVNKSTADPRGIRDANLAVIYILHAVRPRRHVAILLRRREIEPERGRSSTRHDNDRPARTGTQETRTRTKSERQRERDNFRAEETTRNGATV